MKTLYLNSDTLDHLRLDLINNGALEIQPATTISSERLVPKPGLLYVEVGLIEAAPAAFAEDGVTLITPPTYQPGQFANLSFPTETAASDFALLFTPTHATMILPEPENPVSVLLSGGETPTPSSVPFTPQKVPETWVSRRAFFLALYEVAGISPDQIRAGLAGNVTALIEFEAPFFDPANPLFAQLAANFRVSEAQLAVIWAKARRL